MVISNLVEAIVSVNRISSFLDSDELQTDARNVILRRTSKMVTKVLSIVLMENFTGRRMAKSLLCKRSISQ
jgi:uncharacterized Fe-S cluster-containing MiaB family protein